jgi:hypothetical protein
VGKGDMDKLLTRIRETEAIVARETTGSFSLAEFQPTD